MGKHRGKKCFLEQKKLKPWSLLLKKKKLMLQDSTCSRQIKDSKFLESIINNRGNTSIELGVKQLYYSMHTKFLDCKEVTIRTKILTYKLMCPPALLQGNKTPSKWEDRAAGI